MKLGIMTDEQRNMIRDLGVHIFAFQSEHEVPLLELLNYLSVFLVYLLTETATRPSQEKTIEVMFECMREIQKHMLQEGVGRGGEEVH